MKVTHVNSIKLCLLNKSSLTILINNLTMVLRSTFLVFILVSFNVTSYSNEFEKIIFGCYAENMQEFEEFVIRAKQSGATHINLSNEDLPKSYWQYDTPGDPYPAWVVTNVGLLKIAIPEALKPYLPQEYAEEVMKILEERCSILRKHGMKGALKTFEPQMLPEEVFKDHPLWRGPRVDHPMRSKVARWAPSIDHPDVLALYRESVMKLVSRCNEIEILTLYTNDSGTGLDWSGGLYSGKMGNTLYMNKPMSQRLNDFFSVLQKGSEDAGGSLEIDVQWTREKDPVKISKDLERGMAIENLEGPDATQYKSQVGYLLDYFNLYYPVMGIPHPVRFLNELSTAWEREAPRLFVFIGDRFDKDLYFFIYDKFMEELPLDEISKYQFLLDVAGQIAGKENAYALFSVWLNLYECQKLRSFIETGGYIYYLGGVQQRWLTRPFVPYPEELTKNEKEYYRKFQFQGRTEEHADDLIDLQGYRLYSDWSGRYLIGRAMGWFRDHILDAKKELEGLITVSEGETKQAFELFDLRLQSFLLLIENSNNAVSYQAQIDRVKSLGVDPEFRPVPESRSGWDRQLMLETARKEIDNTALLMKLLLSTDQNILDISPSVGHDDIRVLEHNFLESLQKKLDIMNAHWLDYNRLFTTGKF